MLAELPALAAFQGRLGESAAVLVEALQARDELDRRLGPGLRLRAARLRGRDDRSGRRGAVRPRAGGRRAGAGGASRSSSRRCSRSVRERLADWAASEPALAVYAHYLDDLGRRAAHTRSAEVEEVLGLVSRRLLRAVRGLQRARRQRRRLRAGRVASDGEPVDVTQGSIDALLASPDRTLRRSAWESYADGYLGVRNTLAANLAGTVKQAVFQARVRRHESPLAASLSRSNVPPQVFDNLIATFEANLPTWHRYWRLRRRIHGVERLAPYDLAAPLGDVLAGARRTSSASSGSASRSRRSATTYVETVRRGCLEERWVDVYPTAGKMGGAFSAGAPGTAPFIVMSFDGTAVSLGTLAHELGHSMHSYLTWQIAAAGLHPLLDVRRRGRVELPPGDAPRPPARERRRSGAAARRARGGDGELPPLLLHHADAGALRARDPRAGRARRRADRGAARRPHGRPLRRGLRARRRARPRARRDHLGASSAISTSRSTSTSTRPGSRAPTRSRAGCSTASAGAADRYLEFLSAGSSLYPLDALRRGGVDLTSPEPVEQTFAVLASLVDRIEALV